MKNIAVTLLILATASLAQAMPSDADPDRRVETVKLKPGSSSATQIGRLAGREYVDYRLTAAAGQTIAFELQSEHRAAHVNLLPPGSKDVAMFIGEQGGNHHTGMLPTDGIYTLRVFLLRAAARRNEAANYTLKLSVTGVPLRPLAASRDALVPGTRYHATTDIPCQPAYLPASTCRAGVIRRGHDGTATVELAWGKGAQAGMRRILFVASVATAADTPQKMIATRNERGWIVEFGGNERFEIPEPLVMGG